MLFPVVLQAWVSCLFFRDICLPVFDVYGGQKHCLTFLLLQFWKGSKSTMSRRRFTQELVVCWYVGGMLWELCLIQCRCSSWFIMLGVQKCWCLCLPMVKGKSIFFKRHLFWNKTNKITTFPCSLSPRKALSAGAQFENFDRCDSWWCLQDLPLVVSKGKFSDRRGIHLWVAKLLETGVNAKRCGVFHGIYAGSIRNALLALLASFSSTDYDNIALFKRNLTTFFHQNPGVLQKWNSEPEIARESLDGPRRHFPDQRCDTFALTWNIPQGQWWYIIYIYILQYWKHLQKVVCF